MYLYMLNRYTNSAKSDISNSTGNIKLNELQCIPILSHKPHKIYLTKPYIRMPCLTVIKIHN